MGWQAVFQLANYCLFFALNGKVFLIAIEGVEFLGKTAIYHPLTLLISCNCAVEYL